MTGILVAWRQRCPVLLLTAFLCLLLLGLAPKASAAGSGAFSPTGSMSTPRSGAAAAPLPDGRVLVAGGSVGGRIERVFPTAEVFDPGTNSFSSAGIGSMSVPRSGAVAAPLPDGRVLVAGGFSDRGPMLSTAEIFNPATNSFSSAGIGSMSVPRVGAAAAPLPDGRVLVVGGCCSSVFPYSLSSAEVFDPATNSFSSAGTGSMSTPRSGAAAAPLPDGRVLVAGGGQEFGTGGSAEVFNPGTNSFSSAGIGSMSVPRYGAAAAALPDGRVLVAGGGFSDPSSAEVFDPATGTFSSAGIGSMSVERRDAAAAPLPDGRVLVAGGDIGFGSDLSSAETFAPVSCRGKQATIVGTDGADQIFGGPKADVIVGVGGNDELSGLAGKDLICGGQGDDRLNGGAGKDQLYGQQGNDKLYGRKGNDKLYGQAGNDTLKGGPGKDTLKGGAGKDLEAEEKPARRQPGSRSSSA
jgi:RTX calcium-binding nonapeptide repeat (4 copies)/Kelch motif/Galactose oxidase, central domain